MPEHNIPTSGRVNVVLDRNRIHTLSSWRGVDWIPEIACFIWDPVDGHPLYLDMQKFPKAINGDIDLVFHIPEGIHGDGIVTLLYHIWEGKREISVVILDDEEFTI